MEWDISPKTIYPGAKSVTLIIRNPSHNGSRTSDFKVQITKEKPFIIEQQSREKIESRLGHTGQ